MRYARVRAFVDRLFRAAAPAARCPKCGERRLVEWDRALRRFVCDVCSHQWSRAAAIAPPAS